MNSRIPIYLLIILMLFSFGCFGPSPEETPATPIPTVCFRENLCVEVEIADDRQEISRGLMFTQVLAEDQGMLFVFPKEETTSFWMKNTLIPLDMIWITEGGEIIYIEHSAQPCRSDPCRTYGPNSPAKYVLEVNGGYCSKNNVTKDSQIQIPVLPET
ncbi:DUF192 domain-containing protein [Candidatus Altiarchaeota archaeon]